MYLNGGEYAHQLDAKNRIRIPNKLKGETGKLIFSKGPDKRIFVYTEEAFLELGKKISENTKLSDDRQRKALSVFYKSAFPVEADGQGRMILPTVLKDFAKIDRDLVICGAGNHIELWSKEVYDEYYKNEDADFDDLFDILGI